ncbi:MAG: hypothetical protein EU529_02895 [Promethearchaeota archaeon]|nr:MAG: hypothetical protein EU529_02895 [Candidatus Lokiarchaeota archaeon]
MLARKFLFILNLINAAIFVFILVIFSFIFNFENVIENPDGKLVFFAVIYYLKNTLTYSIYFCLYIVALSIGSAIAFLFGPSPDFNEKFMSQFINEFFKNYLSLWFSFPEGETPEIWEIPDLIVGNFLNFLNNLYLFSFLICYIIVIIFFIRAIFQNNPKYSLVAIGFLILMVVIPLMVFGFNNMLRVFNVKFKELRTLVNPLSSKFTDLPLNNFFEFLFSPVALLAIMCYIYLEIAFQINYTDTVTKPSLERSERLGTQLRILRRESILITTDIDKIKDEAKKRREEIEEEEEKVGKFIGKTIERFSYVKEMIEKRKLEQEERKLVNAASKTRRLGRYIDRLLREDPEAENTLTAKTSTPKAKNLVTSTAISFSFRLILLIILSFIIMHPRWFFIHVFNLPPAITESMAMYSPEAIIVLLLPIMLLFPLIAQAISYAKHRNLIIKLKQEGQIKEILASVGDYVKIEEDIEKKEEVIESGAVAAETT